MSSRMKGIRQAEVMGRKVNFQMTVEHGLALKGQAPKQMLLSPRRYEESDQQEQPVLYGENGKPKNKRMYVTQTLSQTLKTFWRSRDVTVL